MAQRQNLAFILTKLEKHLNSAMKGLRITVRKRNQISATFLSLKINLNIFGLKQVMIEYGKVEQSHSY